MEYKISELAQKTGVTKRTIHYYIAKGLLMPPNGSGVNSSYDDTHLERILLIKKLQAKYLPLSKIREYIFEGKNTDKLENRLPQNAKILNSVSESNIYVKENIANIFEIHCSRENAQKYQYVIENVKKYVEKMLED